MSSPNANPEGLPGSPKPDQARLSGEDNESRKKDEESDEGKDEAGEEKTEVEDIGEADTVKSAQLDDAVNVQVAVDSTANDAAPAPLVASVPDTTTTTTAETSSTPNLDHTSELTTLRANLADLRESNQRLKDENEFLTAAMEAVKERLRKETGLRESAEESVEALRGQVEMARRGVMTLQKQEKDRKRASMMGMPSGFGTGAGAGSAGLGIGGSEVLSESPEMGSATQVGPTSSAATGTNTGSTSTASKRSSMLIRHRRVSSQSEPDASSIINAQLANANAITNSATSGSPSNAMSPPSVPPRSGLRELRLGASSSSTPSASAAGGLSSPNPSNNLKTLASPRTPSSGLDDPYAAAPPAPRRVMSGGSAGASANASASGYASEGRGTQVEGEDDAAFEIARVENENLRLELAATQLRLSESEEARQASEDCLKALREFITGSASPPVDDPTSPPLDGAGAAAGGSGSAVVDLADPSTFAALKGIRLPPLPTDRDPDEPLSHQQQQAQAQEKKGWGFKLPTWKAAQSGVGGVASPSSQAVEPATPRSSNLTPPPSIRSSSFSLLGPTAAAEQESGSSGTQAQGAGAGAGTGTPLANFVSSWTKGVAGAGAAPTTPMKEREDVSGAGVNANATPRGFGAFFRRGTTASTTTNNKDKDLPAQPERDEDEVGSVGAEREDEIHESKRPSGARMGDGLQPSPEIKVGRLEQEAAQEREQVVVRGEEKDGSMKTLDSEVVLATPHLKEAEVFEDVQLDKKSGVEAEGEGVESSVKVGEDKKE